jgi:hypothetical protein
MPTLPKFFRQATPLLLCLAGFVSAAGQVTMTKTFSTNDSVLGLPLAPGPGCSQKTWKNLTSSEILVWGTCQHSNILWQWGELAYWFPSVSNATEQQSLSTLTSIDFDPYDPFSLISPNAHLYMRLQPYYIVYPAWQAVHGAVQ